MPATRLLLTLAAAVCILCAADSAREQGIAAFEQGRYSVALDRLTAASKDPADRTAHVFLALTQAALQHCQAALPMLNESQSDQSLAKLAGLAAAKCDEAAGDHLSALQTLSSLEKNFPADADVLYLKAKLHMKAFNDATYAMFQRTPSSYRVHQLSAEVFETQNRFAEAIPEYKKAIELNPQAPDLHFRLGRAILLASHSAEALASAKEEFIAELRVSPEDGPTEFQIGQIAQVQGDSAGARQHFERALTMSPQLVEALIALGKIDAREKKYDEAIAQLERAATIQPANEGVHYALLTAYRDAGRLDKAREEKATLDKLQKPPAGEFSDFLKKLGEPQQKP